MNFYALATRYGRMTPNKIHLALPLSIMAVFYWLSSLPGLPRPEDPALYSVFYWVPPSVQNILHIPAYAALGWAWRWALGAWLHSQAWIIVSAFMLSAGYGFVDEWHQSFVPHRYASLTDILLDILGCALGICAFQWARRVTRVAGSR